MPDYRLLVEFIVKHLVSNPGEVEVSQTENEDGAFQVMVKVAQEDIGRVIGKHGATINSIRLVTKAAAVKSGDRIDVDVEED